MDIKNILKNYIETCKTTGIKVINEIIDKIMKVMIIRQYH